MPPATEVGLRPAHHPSSGKVTFTGAISVGYSSHPTRSFHKCSQEYFEGTWVLCVTSKSQSFWETTQKAESQNGWRTTPRTRSHRSGFSGCGVKLGVAEHYGDSQNSLHGRCWISWSKYRSNEVLVLKSNQWKAIELLLCLMNLGHVWHEACRYPEFHSQLHLKLLCVLNAAHFC